MEEEPWLPYDMNEQKEEQVFVGGFANFLSIYNTVITARILLSWFPQAQGIGALQPVYAVTDPYLNLFRGIIPPIFGLDLRQKSIT